MIGKVGKLGTDFMDRALYLERGPRRGVIQPDRVDWIESRNLPTNDPEAAARIMKATARDAHSIQRPAYFFSISFDPRDPVTREIMRQVADRTLRHLELHEHQALIVAHRDRSHAHMHILVNRVHPERLTVWSNWHDYRRIEQSLRGQERDLGLRIVQGNHTPRPKRERIVPERTPVRLERGDAGFLERVQREAGPHMRGAGSWAELERGLADHGLSVRVDGGGLVVTDGVRKVKASEVDRAASRANLERRLGSLGEYRARQAVAARTLDERAARIERTQPQQPMPAPAPPATARQFDRPPVPPAKADHRRIAASYRGAMARLYADPHAARTQFRAALLRDGREAAAKALRERPETFGRVRPADAPERDRAADAAGEAFRWSGRLEATGRADALRVGATLRQHDAVKAYDGATAALEDAEGQLRGARFQRDQIRDRLRGLPEAAGKVYENPRAALWNVARHVRRDGFARTADALADTPERFGALKAVERPRLFGLRTELDTSAARAAAPRAASRLRGLDFNRSSAAKAGDVLRAQDAVRLARARLSGLQRFGRTPASRATEMQRLLTEAGKVLHAAERGGIALTSKLTPMLPAGKAAGLIRTAASLGRDLAMGVDPDRQHERGRGMGGMGL